MLRHNAHSALDPRQAAARCAGIQLQVYNIKCNGRGTLCRTAHCGLGHFVNLTLTAAQDGIKYEV